jgi:iron complex outermembrane receptor protein
MSFWAALAAVSVKADDAVATNSPTALPSVIVTGQKEAADVLSLPVSDSAVTRTTLDDAGILAVKDASFYAPNTFVNSFTARNTSSPFMRGIGGDNLNPGVTTFIDGVPQLNGYTSNIEFVDVDQVEFVRGPQGGLFGRNTAGGLINITSTRPSSIWTGQVAGQYGNFNYRDVRGSVSGPTGLEGLSMGLAGGYSARDGYTVDDFTGRRQDGREAEFGKGQFLYAPSERFELRVILTGEHDSDGNYAFGDLNYIRAHPHHINVNFDGGFNHRDLIAPTLLANYHGDSVEIASITGGLWWKNRGVTDLDYNAGPTAPLDVEDNKEQQYQFTQEVRVASAKDKPITLGDHAALSWQSGVFFFTQDYQKDVVYNLPGQGYIDHANSDLNDWGAGVYGQAKLTLWEQLDLAAGLRFDSEDKHADLASSLVIPQFPAGNSSAQGSFSRSYNALSPQLSAAWRLATNRMAYLSAANGYRAGGFNPPPAASREFGPENTWNYEAGYKAKWLDGRLETTAALFYIDWRHIQIDQADPYAQYYVSNGGSADSKGVEFAVKYRPLSGWDLFGGIGYTDAEFLSGSAAYNTLLGANKSIGGNRLPNTPSVTGNAGTEVFWAPCKEATLYARAEVDVIGDYEYDPSNAQKQSTFCLANFRAGVRGNHWFAEGWVNNAFDTHYVPIAIPYSTGPGSSGYIGESGAPVTFGVRAGLKF